AHLHDDVGDGRQRDRAAPGLAVGLLPLGGMMEQPSRCCSQASTPGREEEGVMAETLMAGTRLIWTTFSVCRLQ
ncbi:MAG: hypothetical protein L0215_27030, partial [Gemmataceae bacterium]|nr:hypothetical protein [Gemmataceae bacterium]